MRIVLLAHDSSAQIFFRNYPTFKSLASDFVKKNVRKILVDQDFRQDANILEMFRVWAYKVSPDRSEG